jgi:hypothetical protein
MSTREKGTAMRRKIWISGITILATALLVLTSTGCKERLWLSNAVSFGAGWLLRDITMPTTTETLCYRNGEPIDCSEVLP